MSRIYVGVDIDAVSRGPGQLDWPWNRPIVERLVPVSSPDIWWYGRSWTCHLRCHAYHLPIPELVLARSNVASQPIPVDDLSFAVVMPTFRSLIDRV